MDTAWGHKSQGTWSLWNIAERFVTRSAYMVLTTFVAALLPFFGDFIALTGSLSALPLDFVLVLAMTLKVSCCSVCYVTAAAMLLHTAADGLLLASFIIQALLCAMHLFLI